MSRGKIALVQFFFGRRSSIVYSTVGVSGAVAVVRALRFGLRPACACIAPWLRFSALPLFGLCASLRLSALLWLAPAVLFPMERYRKDADALETPSFTAQPAPLCAPNAYGMPVFGLALPAPAVLCALCKLKNDKIDKKICRNIYVICNITHYKIFSSPLKSLFTQHPISGTGLAPQESARQGPKGPRPKAGAGAGQGLAQAGCAPKGASGLRPKGKGMG